MKQPSHVRRLWPTRKPHIYFCRMRKVWVVRYMEYGRVVALKMKGMSSAMVVAKEAWQFNYRKGREQHEREYQA